MKSIRKKRKKLFQFTFWISKHINRKRQLVKLAELLLKSKSEAISGQCYKQIMIVFYNYLGLLSNNIISFYSTVVIYKHRDFESFDTPISTLTQHKGVRCNLLGPPVPIFYYYYCQTRITFCSLFSHDKYSTNWL